MSAELTTSMLDAIDYAVRHVQGGGLPLVGQVVSSDGYASAYGVNRVLETGDPTAHAEIVAIRDALHHHGGVRGLHLVATGEPCGLCYRFAAEHEIGGVVYAVGRDDAARWGFDHRASYAFLGADRLPLIATAIALPVPTALAPFEAYALKEDS